MRVALITPTFIAYHAVPNSIINKCRALKTAGHDVSIFTQRIEALHLPPDIVKQTYIINSEMISKFNQGDQPFTEVLEKWFDTNLYIFDYPHYYTFIDEIRRVEGITGFIYHGITPPSFAAPEKRSLYNTSILFINLLKEADFGIVYSRYTRNELVNKYKFPSQKVIQIPFGIDINHFNFSAPQKLIDKLNIKDKYIISYIGRISPHKNIEFLIRALLDLLRIKKNIIFFIIGDDRGEYEKEKTRLLDITKSLNLEKYIRFIGLVEDLPTYYFLSEVIVSASLHEGCWVPGLEAIVARKPVVASDNTAIPYTVGKAGLYFDYAKKSDYVNKMLQIFEDKNLRDKLKSAADKQINKISLEAHDKAFMQVINNSLKLKKRKRVLNKINPEELQEKLRLLESIKDFKIDYHEFSDRKVVGPLLTKFRDYTTRHIRQFYIKPLELAQANFNDAVVDSYRTLLEYLAEKEKWKIKINKPFQKELEKNFFDMNYFIGGNKSNYGDYKETINILNSLAAMIYNIFHPGSFLDVGCAYGYVPIWLRKKGIHAYGIDVSEFAISQGNKPYLTVGDATNLDKFKNQQFEVLMASELMEHIPENKIDLALKEAKRITKKFIIYLIAMKGFSSHESDHDHDISHVSVKNRKFWLKKFETLGLIRDVEKERVLNTNQFSVKMGWSGRFFVLKIIH